MDSDLLIIGTYNKTVLQIDPRAKDILAQKIYHRGAVLRVQANDAYIVTASDDKTVVVYDRRIEKTFKTLKVRLHIDVLVAF